MVFSPTAECVRDSAVHCPLLKIEAVSKDFGHDALVHNFSFSVGFGEVIGVIGDPGAGKARMIGLLTGEISPNSGHILLDGEDITGLPPACRERRGVARVVPAAQLFPELTVLDNVVLRGVQLHSPVFSRQGGKTDTEEALDLLELVGLSESANMAFETLTDAEKGLVGLACALAAKPSLILFDHAELSGRVFLDQFGEAFRRTARRGASVLFTSRHLWPVIDVCDRVVLLHPGDVVAKGVPTGIVAGSALRRGVPNYVH